MILINDSISRADSNIFVIGLIIHLEQNNKGRYILLSIQICNNYNSSNVWLLLYKLLTSVLY